ncbi:unnamed protein product [Phytophthora lilii]|uniref:Unnamed protein product n=1 Tax=Phytophthora lilii TaxID=2077276 RepID=A0A9W7DDC5_9STRA|nr:unnamed protein product [Phytophthora lilii]
MAQNQVSLGSTMARLLDRIGVCHTLGCGIPVPRQSQDFAAMSSYGHSRSSMSHRRSSVSSSVAGASTALRNDAILYLTILSARELRDVQTLGEQDPYCSVYLTTGGKEQEKAAFKTDTHDNGGA